MTVHSSRDDASATRPRAGAAGPAGTPREASAPRSLARDLVDHLAAHPGFEQVFEKLEGVWTPTTCGAALERARALTVGLRELGLRRGDRIAIMGETRAAWGHCDLAVLCLGGVTVGIYTTSAPREIKYILDHSGARAIFVDDERRLAGLEPADAPALERRIPWTELPALEARGRAALAADPRAFDALLDAVRPEDLATIIYTSGTTGPPKGAMLTHANILSVLEAVDGLVPVGPGDMGVSFLPLAHSLQRMANYAGLRAGARGAFAESIEKLPENWREVRPTIQASVPRIWEKAYGRARARVESGTPLRRALFQWALAVGRCMADYRKRGAERFAPLRLRLEHALADLLVYRRVRDVFGGRVRFLTSGGAPIPAEVLEFFYAMGILILEGWGLTETAAPATLNTPDAFKLGTVGRPIRGTEIRIAEDGEILVRGPGVFKGYWRDEAATAEAFTTDGFFKTGDVGVLDGEGFLRITDRKKSLIVTSSGKKVAPANVETLVKKHGSLISQAYVHGDRRSYIVALVTLDPAEAKLVADPVAAVALAFEAANRELARHEQVKRWRVVDGEWDQASGLVTPTLKQKRKAIEERYAAEIEALYAEGSRA